MSIFNAQNFDDVLGQLRLLYTFEATICRNTMSLLLLWTSDRTPKPQCREVFYYKPNEHQAKLGGGVQTGRLDPQKAEDGSEGKKQSEKQKSTQQAQEPVHNYPPTWS